MLKFAAALAALLVVPVAQAQDAAVHNDDTAPTTSATTGFIASETPSVEHGEESSAPACCRLPAGTPVQLETVELLSSKHSRTGQTFALRLSEPITLNGRVAIPVGTMGVGEIIHASAAAGGGKPGELSLAGRYLTYEGVRITLRGLKFGQSGKDRLRASANVGLIFSPLAFAVRGGEIEVPAGARVNAKLASNVHLAPARLQDGTANDNDGSGNVPMPQILDNPSTVESSAEE